MGGVDDVVSELEEMCAKVIDPQGGYIFFVDVWTHDNHNEEEAIFKVGVRTKVATYTLNPRISAEQFKDTYGKEDYQVTSTGILLPKELATDSTKETVPFEPPEKIFISCPTALDPGPYLGVE